ncbi:MAG: class peptide chain release factor [Deltaproteobacteria bacterium]|nr:class peptide chain release factor [Deltaproteobacteria bacterium]
MIRITPDIAIRETELKLDFIRSSGPGGQNVNKVATAVQLRFDAVRSPSLPEDVRRRLVRIAGKRVSKEGVLLIDARRFRTQERNRQDAVDRLAQWIRRAAEKPKKRIKTKPTRGSRERRLEGKRQKSETKRLRKPVI